MMDALNIADLGVSRGDRRLFQKLFLDVRAGEAVALTGANGAGKTSLLRAIAGFIRPDGGRIEFANNSALQDTDEARRTGLHMLGHLEGLKPARLAAQELAFQCRYLGGDVAHMQKAVEAFHLGPLLDLETRRLSAGQRRRLSLARLVSAPRPLWLLDEPLSPLDSVWRMRAGEQMQAHLASGGMIIAAVHDPLPFAAREFDLGAFS
ncbi:heme ABC exporter ATP-binding protein CcmA [Brevundimonas sp.]|uniref:heme ABC exporter ATP-binding protein CcmA n=1 Tax=Brevundimonas sp. TaxID=1871086 RepID=UPI002FCA7EC2